MATPLRNIGNKTEMDFDARVFVAGSNGLAGHAVVKTLLEQGFKNLLRPSHAELDLEDSAATRAFFQSQRPEYAVIAAAKVGGILANHTYPADFLGRNLAIALNVIPAAHAAGVRRLIFLGSSCIYPRDCPQPIEETSLLAGPLEQTNRAYAIAKIAGAELCWAYNRQHGCRFLAAMPTNLYGPGDNYDLATSHVLPALIRKVHEAKTGAAPEVLVWGSGRPRREFLHSEDLAHALVFLLTRSDEDFDRLVDPQRAPLVNIGWGSDLTIAELATLIAEIIGFDGRLAFDASKPDGTFQKVLDVGILRGLGWQPRISLAEGIARTYREFLSQQRQ